VSRDAASQPKGRMIQTQSQRREIDGASMYICYQRSVCMYLCLRTDIIDPIRRARAQVPLQTPESRKSLSDNI
jgi:hypothetical protein